MERNIELGGQRLRWGTILLITVDRAAVAETGGPKVVSILRDPDVDRQLRQILPHTRRIVTEERIDQIEDFFQQTFAEDPAQKKSPSRYDILVDKDEVV